jgi:hypothetical protein
MLERSNKQPRGVCSSSRGTEDSKPSPGIARRLRSGTATVLDVRLEDEFATGHLPDALNIPLSQLERRLAELPPDQEIIAYCRGPVVRSLVRSRCVAAPSRLPRGDWRTVFWSGNSGAADRQPLIAIDPKNSP